MSADHLLFHVSSAELRDKLLQWPELREKAVDVTGEQHWEEALQKVWGLAVIEVDSGVSSSLPASLATSNPGSETEFVFLSDGTPNQQIDEYIMQLGGYHFRAPFAWSDIRDEIGEILADLKEADGARIDAPTSRLDQFGLLVGSSRPMRRLFRALRKIGNSEASVLVVGESGVGKELVANTIHLASQRANKPFVAINCGALSPELVESELFGHVKGAFTGAHRSHDGVFAQAEGGTLFLDEVTEMTADNQVKLLRVLETGEYRPLGSGEVHKADVRVISATNRAPEVAITDGIFREDLYFRLAQFPIGVPPLRERGADIRGLAEHFLVYRNAEENTSKGITPGAVEKIEAYSWPGNVRELKHCIERAYILSGDVINEQDILLDAPQLDTRLDAGPALSEVPSGVPLELIEQAAIESTLSENEGNKAETAKQLGISVKTLYNKLDKYEKESS